MLKVHHKTVVDVAGNLFQELKGWNCNF